MWLATYNQGALFQHIIITLCKNLFMTSAHGRYNCCCWWWQWWFDLFCCYALHLTDWSIWSKHIFPLFRNNIHDQSEIDKKWNYISTIIFFGGGGFWFCSSYLDLHKFYLFLALFITFESKIFFPTERLEKSCNKNSEKSLLVLLSSLLLPSLLLLLSSSLLLPSLLLAFSVTKC